MNNPLGTSEIPLDVFGGANLEMQPTDLPQGLSPGPSDIAFLPGSMFSRPPLQRFSTRGTTDQAIYNASFTKADGTVVQLVFYSDGAMYADGVKIGQTKAGNRFQTANVFSKCFIATSDGLHGADVPLQYDGQHLDRVSQDGPGASPVFAASSAATTTYPIVSITQPAVGPYGGFAFGLQSTGPGVTAAGSVITQYYADSTLTAGDPDLIAAFNSGKPVYVHMVLTSAPVGMQTPNTALVTSIGLDYPPGEARKFYYFTYNASTVQALYGSGHGGYGIQYQRTLGTVTLSAPAPVLINTLAVITGVTPTAWDATWNITQTLDSGAMSITQSSLIGGTATFSYDVISGANPVAGQLVTITGTLNANGSLNVVNLPIATVTGGTIGTFTITGFPATPNYPAVSESGQATTEGTIFTIEPGLLTLGTVNSPIYGSGSGGAVSLESSTVTIAPGKRQGVVIFQTRTGYLTIPSPPVTFFIPANTTGLVASNIPLGPPNVIARVLAFTGADGGKFFYLPIAPRVNGIVSGTSTVVNDNTTTSATFSFSDEALLAAKQSQIDVPGNNLFRQVVLGPVLGFYAYASRLFAWGERNKIQQYLNMGFEGGYNVLTAPLGWTASGTAGTLVARGDYGQAWQVTGSGVGIDGTLSQPSFQDWEGIAILTPDTQYTFRVWAEGFGSVVATLSGSGFTATATMPVIAGGGFVEAQFSAKTPLVIPADTVLSVGVDGLSAGQVTILDEMEQIYTADPYLQSAIGSYIDNREAFDGVTGIIGSKTDPQPVMAMQERRDTLSLLTFGPKGSLYETEDTASGEPATWNLRHVSAECGILGVLAIAKFEDWFVWVSDTGLRIYDGGTVDKMSQEVQPLWESFNPAAKQFTVLANDPDWRRIYLLCATGTAMVTNSTWVLDYRELNTASALANSGTLRIGYSGKTITTDLTRKWCPWSMTLNYCGMVNLQGGGSVMAFCGGSSTSLTTPRYSAVYTLDNELDGGAVPLSMPPSDGRNVGIDADYGKFWDKAHYPTYFFIGQDDAQQRQIGIHRLLHVFMSMNVTGSGAVLVQPSLDRIGNFGRSTRAVNISPDLARDLEFALNLSAERISYDIKVQPQGMQPFNPTAAAGFKVSSMTVAVKTEPFSPIRGWNG